MSSDGFRGYDAGATRRCDTPTRSEASTRRTSRSKRSGGSSQGRKDGRRGDATHRVAHHAAVYPLLRLGCDVLLDPVPNSAVLDVCLVADMYLVTAHSNGVRVFIEPKNNNSGGSPSSSTTWALKEFRQALILQHSYLCVPFSPQRRAQVSSLVDCSDTAVEVVDDESVRFQKYFAVASGDDATGFSTSVMSVASCFIVSSTFRAHRVVALCLTTVHDSTPLSGTSTHPLLVVCDEVNQLYLVNIGHGERVVAVPSAFLSEASEGFTTTGISVAAACRQYCGGCSSHSPPADVSAATASFVVYLTMNSSVQPSSRGATVAEDLFVSSAGSGAAYEQRTVQLHIQVNLRSPTNPALVVSHASIVDAESYFCFPPGRSDEVPPRLRDHLASHSDPAAPALHHAPPPPPLGMCYIPMMLPPPSVLTPVGSRSVMLIARPRLRFVSLLGCSGAALDTLRTYGEEDMSNGLGNRAHDEYFVHLTCYCAANHGGDFVSLDGDDESDTTSADSRWPVICVGVTNDGSCLVLGLSYEDAFPALSSSVDSAADMDDSKAQLEAWLNDVEGAASEDFDTGREHHEEEEQCGGKPRELSPPAVMPKSRHRGSAAGGSRRLQCSVLWHVFCPVVDQKSAAVGCVRVPIKCMVHHPNEVLLFLSDGTIFSVALPLRLRKLSSKSSLAHQKQVNCVRDGGGDAWRRMKPPASKGSLMYLVTSPFHHMQIPSLIANIGSSFGGGGAESATLLPETRSFTRTVMSAIHKTVAAVVPSSREVDVGGEMHKGSEKSSSPAATSAPPPSLPLVVDDVKCSEKCSSPDASAAADEPTTTTISSGRRVQRAEVVSIQRTTTTATPSTSTQKKKIRKLFVAPHIAKPPLGTTDVTHQPPTAALHEGSPTTTADGSPPSLSTTLDYVTAQLEASRSAAERDRLDHLAEDQRILALQELDRCVERCLHDEHASRNEVAYDEQAAWALIFQLYVGNHEKYLRRLRAARDTCQPPAAGGATAGLDGGAVPASDGSVPPLFFHASQFNFRFVSDDVVRPQHASARFMKGLREKKASTAAPEDSGELDKKHSALPVLHPFLLFHSPEYSRDVLGPALERDRCQFELEDLRAKHRDELSTLRDTEVVVICENHRRKKNGEWEPFPRLPFQTVSGAPIDKHALDAIGSGRSSASTGVRWVEPEWRVNRTWQRDDDDDDDDDDVDDVSEAASGTGWFYAERWPARDPGPPSHWRPLASEADLVRRRWLSRSRIDYAVQRKMESLRKRQQKEEDALRRELRL